MTTIIRHPCGTARRLRSGGWLIDFGDLMPTFAADEDRVWQELNARALTVNRRRG